MDRAFHFQEEDLASEIAVEEMAMRTQITSLPADHPRWRHLGQNEPFDSYCVQYTVLGHPCPAVPGRARRTRIWRLQQRDVGSVLFLDVPGTRIVT